nr:MAG TPA: hypothetical protein [Caudoviricetes sp.]
MHCLRDVLIGSRYGRKLLIQIVMFNIIRKHREKKLRERCIKYALRISNVYTTHSLIDAADNIYNYISRHERQ